MCVRAFRGGGNKPWQILEQNRDLKAIRNLLAKWATKFSKISRKFDQKTEAMEIKRANLIKA